MSRNPVYSQVTANFRYVALHPDGTEANGDWWPSEKDAHQQARDYAKNWLASVKRLGLESQKIRVGIQTRFQEVRVFHSRPSVTAEYSQVEVDRYGNVYGMS